MDLKKKFFNLFIFLLVLNKSSYYCDYAFNELQDESLNEEISLKAKLGTSVQFLCDFRNDTTRNILWIKENSGVISINGDVKLNRNKYFATYHRINDSRVQHTLKIANLEITDQGKYICQHYDLAIVNYFNLVVLIPPSDPIVTYTINNHFSQNDDYDQINLNENDDLDLKCFLKSKGNPQPSIHWLKNGVFISNQSYLNVPNVNSFDHSDTYTCVVTHEALNDTTLVHTVKLNVFSKPYLSLYLKSMKNNKKSVYQLIENTSETLICSSKVNPKLTRIEWFKDGVHLSKYTQNRIELYNLNKNDSGKYECRMHNILGTGYDSIVLEVQYKPHLEILSVHDVIEDAINYEVACKIDSFSSNFSVKWLQIDNKNETTQLENSNIYLIKTNTSCSTLQISRISRQLSKFKYKCIVSMHGYSLFDELIKFESNSQTLLNVLYKPMMNSSASVIIYEPGSVKSLTCLINSNPASIFYWYFNETLVYQDSNISIQHKNFSNEIFSSTLTIYETNTENAGFYKCYAKNKIGFASNIFILKQASEPSVPNEISLINKTHSEVVINWKLALDGGSNQTSFTVLVYDEENLCQEINTSNKFLRVNSLEESSNYKIKIRAKNKYGKSDWSNIFQVQTEEYNFTSSDANLKVSKIDPTETSDIRLHLSFNETKFNLSYFVKLQIEYLDMKKSELVYELQPNQSAVILSLHKDRNKINQYSLYVCFRTKRQLEVCSLQQEIQAKLKMIIASMENRDFFTKSNNLFARYQKSLFYISMIFLSILLLILVLTAVSCCIWNYIKRKFLLSKKSNKKKSSTNKSNNNTNNKKVKNRKNLDLEITNPISAYSNDDAQIEFQYPILFTSELYNNKTQFNKPESQHISFFSTGKQMAPLPELSEESSLKTSSDSINCDTTKYEYSPSKLHKQESTSFTNEDEITQSSFKSSSQDIPSKTKLDDEDTTTNTNKDESILYKVKKKVFEIVV